MTPREPDRFEEKAREIVDATIDCMNGKMDHAECVSVEDHIAAALRAVGAETLEQAAQLALNPYGEEVQCYGGDEPFAVGKKIAKAIRALASPAAAPAAERIRTVPMMPVDDAADARMDALRAAQPSEPAAPAPTDFLTEAELRAAEERCRAADRLASLFGGDVRSEFARMVAEIRFRRTAPHAKGEAT